VLFRGWFKDLQAVADEHQIRGNEEVRDVKNVATS
jgi:hypothetical protein